MCKYQISYQPNIVLIVKYVDYNYWKTYKMILFCVNVIVIIVIVKYVIKCIWTIGWYLICNSVKVMHKKWSV